MSLRKKRRQYFGDSQADIREYLIDYAHDVNRHTVEHFADAVCKCGHRVFGLLTDEDQGVAVRICAGCEERHPMGDSADYLDEAHPGWHSCLCKGDFFEITVGVALSHAQASRRSGASNHQHIPTEPVEWLASSVPGCPGVVYRAGG